MQPCERSELGGVGEGVKLSDSTQPLTAATSDRRSQVSLPLPMGEGVCYRTFVKAVTRNARRLRRDMTEAERQLWKYLRNRQMEGYKFRRQEPVQNRIADFLCAEAKLIVELDGGQHGVQIEADAERTRQLEAAGFAVLRFWNSDVLTNTEGVLHEIRRTLLIAKGQ